MRVGWRILRKAFGGFDPLRNLHLLLAGQQGDLANLLEIHADRVVQYVEPRLIVLLVRLRLLDAVHFHVVNDLDIQIEVAGWREVSAEWCSPSIWPLCLRIKSSSDGSSDWNMEVAGNTVKLASASASGAGKRRWLDLRAVARRFASSLAGSRHFAYREDYFPTDTEVPTLVVPPPAAMPSLAATVVMNVPTMVLRYRFNVL